MLFDILHREKGLNLYFRIKDWASKKDWRVGENAGWDDDVNREDTLIFVTETPSDSGDYPIEMEGELTGSGTCNIIVYKMEEGTPQDTDEIVYGVTRPYGSIFGF